jgi:hypothetical protein
VRCAAAGSAADSAQGFVALNVLVRVLWMSVNRDGAYIVVGPQRAQSSTSRAIAVGDLSWATGDLNSNGTAVTRSFEHSSAPTVN